MPENKIPVAACYRRVSSTAQAGLDKYSLEDQLKAAQDAASARGWQLDFDYVEPGISGELFTERPALQQMLQDAASHRFDVLIVYNGDRLARDYPIYVDIVSRVEWKACVPILDLSNPFPVDPFNFNPRLDDSNFMLRHLRGILSHLDNNARARRTAAGLLRRVERGIFPSSTPPWGYRAVYRPKAGAKGGLERWLEPDPDRFEILRQIPRLVLDQGYTLSKLLAWLEKQGQPPNRSAHWAQTSLNDLLHNPFYSGYVAYRQTIRVPGTKRWIKNPDASAVLRYPHSYGHPWTEEDFDRMQAQLAARKRVPARLSASKSPLAGIIKCGICGGAMMYLDFNKACRYYEYFVCGQARLNPQSCSPSNATPNRVPAFAVLPAIATELDRLVTAHTAGLESLNQELGQQDRPQQSTAAAIKARIAAKERELREILPAKRARADDAFLQAAISPESYNRLLGTIESEKEATVALLSSLRRELSAALDLERKNERIRTALDKYENEFRPYLLGERGAIANWPDGTAYQMKSVLQEFYSEVRSAGTRQGLKWKADIEFVWRF